MARTGVEFRTGLWYPNSMTAYLPSQWPRHQGGLFNMGQTRVPPLPPFVAMTDRADGTVWYLSHNVDFSRIAVNNVLAAINLSPVERFQDITTYGPNDGPWLTTQIQIFVRSGRIGYDFHPLVEQGVTFYGNPTPWSRRKVQRTSFKIAVGTLWHKEGDRLSFITND
jgi:hypothetical protein